MECPKCRKTVGEHDAVCRNCGIALREKSKKTKSLKDFFKRNQTAEKMFRCLKPRQAEKALGIL